MKKSQFEATDAIIDNALREGIFPGIACGVWKNGKAIYKRLSGFSSLESISGTEAETSAETSSRIAADSLFDLASLTKPLSTAILFMRAKEAEGFPLSDPIGRFLPELPASSREISLIDILTHRGGLPPIPALQQYFPDPGKIDVAEAERHLLETEAATAPGKEVVYSCTGYLLLGLVLKRLAGTGLARLFRDQIALPLGLADARYQPLSFAPRTVASRTVATVRVAAGEATGTESGADLRMRSVATEYCAWRKRRIRGEVHDESSYCLGGEGGNAGLFASLGDVAKIATLFLQEGSAGGKRVLSSESVRLMTSCLTEGLNRRRAIGFMMHDAETQDGPAWPERAFGHTGFTGTSVFVDPGRRLIVVALTNRVYAGRAVTEESMPRFRRDFHTAVLAESE